MRTRIQVKREREREMNIFRIDKHAFLSNTKFKADNNQKDNLLKIRREKERKE